MNITLSLETVAAWIWQTSWQASVLVALVLLVQWLLAKKLVPSWRYGLWLLVVARLILPAAPESRLSVFNWIGTAPAQPAFAFPRPNRTGLDAESGAVKMALEIAPPAAAISGSTIASAPPASNRPEPAFRTSTILSLIWLAGAVLLAAGLVWQYLRLNRRLAGAVCVSDPAVLETLDEAKRALGLRRSPMLLETGQVGSPALFGFLRVRLLLPLGLSASLSPQELRHVFLHEAAHLKRGDMIVNWAVTILQVLHWFNPILWLGFARLRADRELACDALALSSAKEGEGRNYAQTIIKLLEGCARPKALPGLVGILEDKNQMKRRIAMIVKFKNVRRWSGLALVLIAGLGVVALTDAQDKKLSDTDKLIEEIRKLGGKVTFDKPGGNVVGVSFEVFDNDSEEYRKTPQFNDRLLAEVTRFTRLRELRIPGTAVTDKGLSLLKNLKSLEKLNLAETALTDTSLENIKPLSQLKELNLSWTRLSDGGLKHLSGFPHLRALELAWLGITDAALVHLQNCSQLEKLNLWRNKITDEGLAHLAGLVKLRDLHVGGCGITGSGFEQLKPLTELRILGLPLAKLTDDGLKSLQHFTELRDLNLNFNERISDAGLSSLKRLSHLTSLALHGTGITGEGLAYLGALTELRELRLHMTKVDDEGLRHIEKLPQLELLGLTRTSVTEAGLESVVKLPRIKKLYLWPIKIGKAGLSTLKRMHSLEELSLPLTDPAITDDDLRHLKQLSGLRYLTLTGPKITDAGLKHLEGLSQLEELDLTRTATTDGGLADLQNLRGLRSITLTRTAVTDSGLVNLRGLLELRSLTLADTKVAGSGFSQLADMSKLRSLDLGGCPVSDDALIHVNRLRDLADLTLRDTKVTDKGLAHLAALPRLQNLDLERTAVTDQGLANLGDVSSLSFITLGGTRVTDAGMTHLLRFRELFAVFLDGTSVSDAGLAQLKTLPKLHNLKLGGTRVTRGGLVHLKEMTRLRWLTLDQSLVDEKVRAEFKQANPDLTIQTVMTKTDTQAALEAVLKSAEQKPVDPNGTWKWTTTLQSRNHEWTLKLHREGERLTGTITGQGVVTEIQAATITGDVIAFQERREAANGVIFSNKFVGKILGDTIQGKIAAHPGNGPPWIGDWQAKRESAK